MDFEEFKCVFGSPPSWRDEMPENPAVEEGKRLRDDLVDQLIRIDRINQIYLRLMAATK